MEAKSIPAAALAVPQHRPSCEVKPAFPCSGSDKKIRRNPGVLIKWIHTHSNNPYPTKKEKDLLTYYAGMNLRQLNDWFANARRNIKKKGGYEKWKEKHPGHSAHLTVPGSCMLQIASCSHLHISLHVLKFKY